MSSFLDCTVGREALPTGRASLMIYLYDAANAGKKVTTWQRLNAQNPGPAITPRRTMAMPGAKTAHVASMGHWDHFRHEVDDGLIMILAGSLVRRGASRPLSQYRALITRETGPLYLIKMPTTCWSKGALTEVTVSGRFDLLDYQECLERGFCGVEDVLTQWKTDTVSPLFQIREVSPETSPRPRRITDHVINSDGQSVKVAVRDSRRGLVLD